MGVWAWVILMAWSAALATAAQYPFFRKDRGPADYDWVYIAGGALLFGFTASYWYQGFGPSFNGLWLFQGLAGGVVGGVVLEAIYRFFYSPAPGSKGNARRLIRQLEGEATCVTSSRKG